MASTINATPTSSGLISSADNSGVLALQTGGTTAVTIDTAQKATFVNDASISGLTVGKGGGSVATNTVLGNGALASNTTASSNTAVGYQAGYSNTTATVNTFIGNQAGYSTTTGDSNTYLGDTAGYTNSTANRNTFIGRRAGYTSNLAGTQQNTFIGWGSGQDITSGAKNSILGSYNGNQGGLDIRTASNWIVLSDGDGSPRILHNAGGTYGYFSVASVYNNTTANGANVWVDSSGTMWRSTSSLKYKKDVEDATHGLKEVMKLRPVTYRQKNTDSDGNEVTQKFGGLIAEEVDALGLSEFVQYADDGTPDALAYGNMVSLLVKAVQELKSEFDAYKASHP